MLGTRIGTAFAVAALTSILVAMPGGAQDPPERSLTVATSSAHPGQSFGVAGTGCVGTEGTGTRVTVQLVHVREEGLPYDWAYDLTRLTNSEIEDDGDWSATVSIPVDHAPLNEILDPADAFEIGAACRIPCADAPSGYCVVDYEGVPFDVLPVPEPEPEPTTPADPPVSTPPHGDPTQTIPDASPATPVVAAPTYTG